MREIQDFERENISMSPPNLDSTPIVLNTTNRTRSPIESITVGTKMLVPTPLTQPTEFPEQNGKLHITDDLDLEPSLSDSSSKKKKHDKNKKRRKNREDDSSEPSSSNNSYLSNDSYYRRKQHKIRAIGKRIRSNYAHV